jgi:hypothetical protein
MAVADGDGTEGWRNAINLPIGFDELTWRSIA